MFVNSLLKQCPIVVDNLDFPCKDVELFLCFDECCSMLYLRKYKGLSVSPQTMCFLTLVSFSEILRLNSLVPFFFFNCKCQHPDCMWLMMKGMPPVQGHCIFKDSCNSK